MRTTSPLTVNPFMMITEPETIIRAVERSERLGGLKRHVCRPLDKPLIPKRMSAELAAYDHAIDDAPDEQEATAGLQ